MFSDFKSINKNRSVIMYLVTIQNSILYMVAMKRLVCVLCVLMYNLVYVVRDIF